MSVAAIVSPAVAKEVRALLPVWALVVAGLAGSFFWDENLPIGFIVYGIGVLALGAQSIGQEYSYGTLPMLLAQPIDRGRLLRRKVAVLIPMLLTVLALASLVFLNAYRFDYATSGGAAALTMPVICALLLTPWLTMLCRSTLAGVVFSIALPGGMLALATMLGGPPGGGVAMVATLVLCAVGGALGWQRFMNLEAIDGAARSLYLPRLFSARQPHHPLWMLARKELHLQHLIFILVAVFLGIWVLLFVSQRARPDAARIPLDLLAPLFLVVMAMLTGALASAEERHLGMLESQQMLPLAASRQWLVKVAVVFGLAVLFAIGLPALLGWINNASGGPGDAFRRQIAVGAIVATAGGLYISSLCRSGVHAAVLSIAIVPTALSYYVLVLTRTSEWISWLLLGHIYVNPGRWVERASALVLVALVVGLLVRLGYINHRRADTTSRQVVRQALFIVAYLAGLSLVQGGISVVLTPR